MSSITISGSMSAGGSIITFARVGAGWRKVRAKLRSWLMRFEDWGSV